MVKILSKEELKDYIETEKQKIIEKYGKLTEETIRKFIEEGCVERFRDKYFKEHNLDCCSVSH